MCSALVSMAKECPWNIVSYILAAGAFLLVGFFGANSILVLIACASLAWRLQAEDWGDEAVIFLELFFTFLKIGAFTFGGGYAMLPLIQQEVVSHQWMTLEQLVNFIAVSESTPGPLAVNLSTYVGAETGGLLGALCATFGVVLPSFVIILIVAKFYQPFRAIPLSKAA